MVNVGILCHQKSLLKDVATYAKIRCLFSCALSKKIEPKYSLEFNFATCEGGLILLDKSLQSSCVHL